MKIKDNTIQSLHKYAATKLDLFLQQREAEAVVARLFDHFLNFDRADLVLKKDERVSESVLLSFYQAIKKIEKQIPLQYVLGETDFYGLKITVNESVLIPRPETEELVDWIVHSVMKPNSKILDIGTGSGCIALALKANLVAAKITACDVSQSALEVAQQNAMHLQLPVEFFLCDILQDNLIDSHDIVVSNPPYIPINEKKLMKNNVKDHEPEIALFVEDHDPLLFYRLIAHKAYRSLNSNGLLFFEINESYGEEVVRLMRDMGFNQIELKKDMQGKNRMVKGMKND